MHYDFDPNPNRSSNTAILHSMITYNYKRLRRLIEGTEELMDYKGPDNNLNSIAQLLRHLTVVDLHWVYRIQSKELPKTLKEKFGPMYDDQGKIPIIEKVPLEILMEEYDQVQEQLKEVCMRIKDEDLNNTVPFENGNSASIRWGIWHVADHSRHHYANIAFLKKIFKEKKEQY
jgi:uncharacterized damage-inducible protein DinB